MNARLLTVLGHVDHGKTTYVDSLLAANNIISQRMAGKIRYLDSREDEQERGITMESSAISLRFKMRRTSPPHDIDSYVINLIDTPGHVDFSSEVSSASRLCDGALVLVDVVEGVCTQTIAVLRQAWQERLRPILVLNKFDRLITELKLSPSEAYHHLIQVIENVNAVIGSFYTGERMEEDLRWREKRDQRQKERSEKQLETLDRDDDPLEDEEAYEEKDDQDIYFAPERGNVIFASAIDGWAFRIGKFAQLYAKKLGIKEGNLRKVLWGDFYLDPKTKRVVGQKQLKGRNLKPLFVQFILDNIWAVYENVLINPNPDKVAKIVTALDLKITPRDLRSKDTKHTINLIFSQWLSLSTCTFQAVVEIIPPPTVAQAIRLPNILHPEHSSSVKGEVEAPKNKLEKDMYGCDAGEEACVVGYVSKMFAVPYGDLPRLEKDKPVIRGRRQPGAGATDIVQQSTGVIDLSPTDAADPPPPAAPEPVPVNEAEPPTPLLEGQDATPPPPEADSEVLLGFARLYSGTLRTGSIVYYLLPKYNTAHPPSHRLNKSHIGSTKVAALYEMMGRELVRVEEVKAGNVFAVEGLGGVVGRNATICAPSARGTGEKEQEEGSVVGEGDEGCFVNLAGVNQQASAIVRVAVEPTEPANLPKLVAGLRLLSQSDPCVQSFQQQTGEWVILTAGELHLERCLRDLRLRFAKIEIQHSEPIVPFRETAVKAAEMPPSKSPSGIRGTIQASSALGVVTFTLRAVPLPETITAFLLANTSIIKQVQAESSSQNTQDQEDETEEENTGELARHSTVSRAEFWPALEKLLDEAGPEWKGITGHIAAFGPNRVGPNLLINQASGLTGLLRDRTLEKSKDDSEEASTPNVAEDKDATPASSTETRVFRDFEGCLGTGFQIATFQGPMCAEPMEGMAFFVESFDVDVSKLEGENVNSRTAQVNGSLISAVKDSCRAGLLDWAPRLKMAMYACDIQASTEVLGKVYAVIARRRGKIISEEMKEGTSFFSIHALLPVVESFGFSDDIRKRSSGAASPQLIFNGYEVLDQDPYWVPSTEEELEDLGEKADRANVARGYMDAVRKRKGMFVEKKVVEFAEKQRTLKR